MNIAQSIWDGHLEIVRELIKRGEKLYVPPGMKDRLTWKVSIDPKFFVEDAPSVYWKKGVFGTHSWYQGTASRNKDGTVSLIYDHMIGEYGPFYFWDLGICSPQLWYLNYDVIRESKESKKMQRDPAKCPVCGKLKFPGNPTCSRACLDRLEINFRDGTYIIKQCSNCSEYEDNTPHGCVGGGFCGKWSRYIE